MLSIDRREGQAIFLNDTKVRFVALNDKNTITVSINDGDRVMIKQSSSLTIEDSELIFISYREFPLKKGGNLIKVRFGIKGNAIVKRAEIMGNEEGM